MKKILSLLAIMLLAIAATFGQAPPGIFNYQGVARNSVGNALVNKTITLRLTIRDGAAAGPLVYQESRTVTTNPFGLFNVQVGSGGTLTQVGTITGVTWSVNTKFIQVEIDPNGGTNFINIGTAQIASVPYAFHSASSNDLILPFNKTQADNGTLFKITNSGNNSGSTALEGLTNSTQANAAAIIGTVTNTSPGGFSTGVKGINNGTGGLGIGVWGSQNGSGYGVYGTAPAGWAVRGEASTTGVGVHGQSSSGIGVFGTSNTGNAGRFDITNSANNTDALVANTNGAAASWAIRATSTGQQGAGIFTYNNAAGAANALRVTNNGSGAAVSATGSGTGSAGVFTNTNAANNASTVAITTNATAATALSVSGPGIWGSAIGITNTTSGQEWRTAVNGTSYIATKITGATFTPFELFADGQVEFASTTGATRLRILNDGTVGINTSSPVNTSKMHINGTGTAGSILTRTSLFTGGNLDGANGHGLIADGEWRAVWGRNLGTGGRVEATGLRGEAGGSGYINGTGVFATAIGSGSLNMGAFGNASGSATANFGIRGQANGATAGQNWGSFAFAGASTAQNVAVGGQAAVNANSWAGAFFGRVAIIDGTQAANRVFTSDAGGNGSWQPLGAIGAVGGSGTLNRIAKWTPDGFNIGNSLSWDDGSRVRLGLGATFADNNSLTVLNTGATGNDAVLSLQGGAGFGNTSGIYIENATNRTHLTTGNFNAASGTKVMTWDGGNQNVGIAIAAPTYRLDVRHGGGGGANVQSTAGFSVVDINAFNGDAALRLRGGNGWHIGNGLANGLTFATLFGPTRAIIENGTGRFGVAMLAPTARVHADGDAAASFAFTNGFNAGPAGIFSQTSFAGASAGVVGYSNNGGSQNTGVNGDVGGSATFNIGGGFLAEAASANTNIGVFARAANGATNYAGWFQGTVRIIDGTQGVGRIFSDDGSGSGTGQWRTPAAAGLVSGSGTLNFVPKWTPNGNTLGNSLIFDNGSSVNIGTTTPTFAGLNTLQNSGQTRAAGTNPGLWADKTAAGNRNFLVFRTGGSDRWSWGTEFDENLRLHNWTTSNDAVMYGDIATDNIGFSTAAPAAKIHIENSASQVGLRLNNSNAIASPRTIEVEIAGIGSNNDALEIGVQAGAPNDFQFLEFDRGGTNEFAVNGNGAIDFNGPLRPSFGTGGTAGQVLTSNGPTVAPSWQTPQGPVGIKLSGLNAAVTAPFFTYVPITQWNTVEYEKGSLGNYNGVSGAYTVPVSGTYHVVAHVLWQQPGATGSGYVGTAVFINGVQYVVGYDNATTANAFSGNRVSTDVNLNAGDQISIRVFHRTSGNLSLNGASYESYWSADLIK